MNRRELLTLALGMGMTKSLIAAQNKPRQDDPHYPSLLYKLRATASKEPGVHRVRIDNRTLEITLPEPPPDSFFMPEAVTSKGEGEAFAKILKQKRRVLECFSANWSYGLLRGVLTPFVDDSDGGGIWARLEVKEHAGIYVEAPGVVAPGYTVKGKKYVDLDYFKLEDFVQAVHGEGDTDPYRVETINGRRWVREMRVPQEFLKILEYRETFYTPVDRQRILHVRIGVSDNVLRYATPEDMPHWLREMNRNITAVLRSIKLSPPDDGSPDPFLLDPEQKPEAVPIEFPGWRR